MSLSKREFFKLTDMSSAAHALDVWANSVQSYAELSELLGYLDANELRGDGDHFYDTLPTEIARKRATTTLMARWKWHICDRIARESTDEFERIVAGRCRAAGVDSRAVQTFLAGCVHKEYRPPQIDNPPTPSIRSLKASK
jgi:hypothetical protein